MIDKNVEFWFCMLSCTNAKRGLSLGGRNIRFENKVLSKIFGPKRNEIMTVEEMR
jgi:hypothetical protein